MATTTRSIDPDKLLEPLEELGEQMISATRKAAVRCLDSYEKAIDRAVNLELKLAETTEQQWLKGMLDTHADLTRELTQAYTGPARELLR